MFLFPAISQICDECGTSAVCTTIRDTTGEFPVCPQCRVKHADYYARETKLIGEKERGSLVSRIARRKMMATA